MPQAKKQVIQAIQEAAMKIINFSHPITQEQVAQIASLLNITPDQIQVITVPVNLDLEAELAPQIANLVDNVGLTGLEWQTIPFVVNLPGLSVAAAMIIAEIGGRAGYLPHVIRLVREGVGWSVKEVIDLQSIRNTARRARW
jgi:hypothetical protein